MCYRFSLALPFIFFCSSILLAQQGNTEQKPMELGIGYRFTEAPSGLLGDMTNVTPAWGIYLDFSKHIKRDRTALRVRIASDTWGSHEFRGTDGCRTKVERIAATAGLMFFFGYKNIPDSTNYICLEAGASKWSIDSSYQPLRGSTYQKPVFGIQYGNVWENVFLECGVEANFLDTSRIDFKNYDALNVAINLSLGFKFHVVRKK